MYHHTTLGDLEVQYICFHCWPVVASLVLRRRPDIKKHHLEKKIFSCVLMGLKTKNNCRCGPAATRDGWVMRQKTHVTGTCRAQSKEWLLSKTSSKLKKCQASPLHLNQKNHCKEKLHYVIAITWWVQVGRIFLGTDFLCLIQKLKILFPRYITISETKLIFKCILKRLMIYHMNSEKSNSYSWNM